MDQRICAVAVNEGLLSKKLDSCKSALALLTYEGDKTETWFLVGNAEELPGLTVNLVYWMANNFGKDEALRLLSSRINDRSVRAPVKVFVCLDNPTSNEMEYYPYTMDEWLKANNIVAEYYLQ